jgi:hypothetical protein
MSPLRLALLAPALAASFLSAGFVVLEGLSVTTPLSTVAPGNLAEAVALGLGSETLRYLAEDQRPETVFELRPEIISRSITRATALEAAIWSRRAQLIKLLDRKGVLGDANSRRHMTCLAVDLGVDEIVEYFGRAIARDCVPDEALRAVEARSR